LRASRKDQIRGVAKVSPKAPQKLVTRFAIKLHVGNFS